LTTQLNELSTDELFAEVLNRSAGDRPTLNRIQTKILRALLDDCDQKTDTGAQS
jgi:hypothetical protein